MIKITEKLLKIDTLNTSLIVDIKREVPQLLYYGKKLRDREDYSFFCGSIRGKRMASQCDNNMAPCIMSSNGECNQKESFAQVVKDGIFTNRFKLKEVCTVDSFDSPLATARNKGEIVRLSYKDAVSGATLNQYYTTFDDSDVIAAHSEIVNTADGEIVVDRLMSVQLDFIADRAAVSSFDGQWAYERRRHDTELVSGRYENASTSGISSSEHNPFIIATVNGGKYAMNLIWSGNHKELVEVSPYGRVRILAGMNDYGLRYPLKSGEVLVSPEAIMVYCDNEDEITHQMHKFSLDHIISPNFAYKDRPVLINNWEGTEFDFTGDKIYDIAEQASRCGIEMMVLDDGWFGARNGDNCALGDWYDNVSKTGGLKKLADRVKALGMKFGLWVEPEMISINSDLYRAHPEYAQAIPGVTPVQRRNQLCIDLCNDEVVDYLADTLIELFKHIGVDYVKWDHNRSMSDIYSHKLADQGKYFYDYYKNQVKLLTRITEACPNILFESCASGGSRYDLGIQYFMPQNWASDNTTAYDRLFIQEGTLFAYPQSSMGAHVAENNLIPMSSLESRFNVAAVGAFGYELDITTCPEEELAIITDQVAYYKEHRHLLQFGNYVRINSIFNSDIGGWMVVSDDKSEAMATVVSKTEGSGLTKQFISFKGLDPDALYKVTSRPQVNYDIDIEFEAYGDALMNGNFDLNVLHRCEKDSKRFSARFASRMLYIKKI